MNKVTLYYLNSETLTIDTQEQPEHIANAIVDDKTIFRSYEKANKMRDYLDCNPKFND